ncbi:hypothetical protein DXG01_009185 [Tephrocybe rancida]|nr:hypothetical protein DXG01_009185 [Tephrocybe rancida]
MLDSPSQLKSQIYTGKFHPHEYFWIKYQPFLLRRGYDLRPRYKPGWAPTWHKLGESIERLYRFEDALTPKKEGLLDAVRLSDNRKVVLKRVETSREELPIGLYLSSESLSHDPRNNAVPILDVMLLPDDDSFALIVMPLLFPFHALPFRRVGEFSNAMKQYTQFNLMVDATDLLPQGWHFLRPHTHNGIDDWTEWRERSTCRSLRYYFIDFGLSRRYLDNKKILDVGSFGQDQSYPERSDLVPYDPFKTDIYQLGNVILETIEVRTLLLHNFSDTQY